MFDKCLLNGALTQDVDVQNAANTRLLTDISWLEARKEWKGVVREHTRHFNNDADRREGVCSRSKKLLIDRKRPSLAAGRDI